MRTERQLAAVPDESVPDRAPIGRLAAAAHELCSIHESDQLTAAIPELARTVCPGTAAALLRLGASGTIEFLSSAGPFQTQSDGLAALARAVLDSQSNGTNGARRLAVFPLAPPRAAGAPPLSVVVAADAGSLASSVRPAAIPARSGEAASYKT